VIVEREVGKNRHTVYIYTDK